MPGPHACRDSKKAEREDDPMKDLEFPEDLEVSCCAVLPKIVLNNLPSNISTSA